MTSCASTANQVGTAVGLTADLDPSKADATSSSFTPSAPGSYCFFAVYSDDTNYTGSNDGSVGECFTVSRASSTTVTTPSPPQSTNLGQSWTDSAAATRNAG